MNAQELADYFEYELKDVFPYCILTIRMLREQADRIAELEKEVEECWCGGHSYEYLRAKNRLPQTKPLSDEEIKEVWLKRPANTAEDVVRFARAIEERHGIK